MSGILLCRVQVLPFPCKRVCSCPKARALACLHLVVLLLKTPVSPARFLLPAAVLLGFATGGIQEWLEARERKSGGSYRRLLREDLVEGGSLVLEEEVALQDLEHW